MKAKYGKNFELEENALIFSYTQFFLKQEEIINLLDRLNLIVEEFANGQIDICFNCGKAFYGVVTFCPTCEWKWEYAKNTN